MRRLVLVVCAASLCAGLPAGAASAADLDKAISFSGPQSLRSDDNPNDYRLWGNRTYVQQSHTRWVKLWVSWYDLQQDYTPPSRADSWRQLDKSANLARLDAQVRAANADGAHVLLSLYQAFPTWASDASGPDPLSSKPAIQKLPLDLSPGGPWGWFVGYLSDRYDGTSALAGRVDALEVVNEPNLLLWPQDGIAANTATMMRSAEQLSFVYGQQAIMGPATSDYPDPGGARPGVNTDWRTFTADVLDALAGWQPRVPVHWSQHNYRDVKYEDPPETSRAKQTIDTLAAGGWPERALWLTEGGLNLGSSWADPATRDAQAAKIAKNFEAMRSLPEVALWTQHEINDVAGNNFKSGLRDDFDAALPGPGVARPAWTTWLSLDGARPATEPVASAAGAGDFPPGELTAPAESSAAESPAAASTPFATPAAADAPSTAIPTPAAQSAPVANAAELAPAAPTETTGLPSEAQSATVCVLSAPKSAGRSIRIGRRGLLTLPHTRLTAGATACSATVSVSSRRMRATKAINLEPYAARSITIKVKRPHANTAVTIRISVRSPGFGTRTWHTRLARS